MENLGMGAQIVADRLQKFKSGIHAVVVSLDIPHTWFCRFCFFIGLRMSTARHVNTMSDPLCVSRAVDRCILQV